ncbi:unnamed protein product [Arabis nemorensis]|uniref:Uncharacterized protein n=1 Tax=Arabis nemorensis TaxID=586526 RepID=A0A565AUC0_9BRAS|nr:unnamed protein product [Arabis nemorensis]
MSVDAYIPCALPTSFELGSGPLVKRLSAITTTPNEEFVTGGLVTLMAVGLSPEMTS